MAVHPVAGELAAAGGEVVIHGIHNVSGAHPKPRVFTYDMRRGIPHFHALQHGETGNGVCMHIKLTLNQHRVHHLAEYVALLIDRVGHTILNRKHLCVAKGGNSHTVLGQTETVKIADERRLDAVATACQTVIVQRAAAVPLVAQLLVADIVVYIVAILYHAVLHVLVWPAVYRALPQRLFSHWYQPVVILHLVAHHAHSAAGEQHPQRNERPPAPARQQHHQRHDSQHNDTCIRVDYHHEGEHPHRQRHGKPALPPCTVEHHAYREVHHHTAVQGKADVRYIGHYVAVRQAGYGEPPHKAHNSHHKHSCCIGQQHHPARIAGKGLRGKHHDGDAQQRQHHLDGAPPCPGVGGPQHTGKHQQEEPCKGLQQAALFGHLPLLAPAAFKQPVDTKEHPCHVGQEHRRHH